MQSLLFIFRFFFQLIFLFKALSLFTVAHKQNAAGCSCDQAAASEKERPVGGEKATDIANHIGSAISPSRLRNSFITKVGQNVGNAFDSLMGNIANILCRSDVPSRSIVGCLGRIGGNSLIGRWHQGFTHNIRTGDLPLYICKIQCPSIFYSTVTANYSGTVARTDCETVTYTAIFGSMSAPDGDSAGEAADTATTAEPMDTTPLVIGAVVLAIAVGGVFGVKKLKERR